MVFCEGYQRNAHEVENLYGKGLCERCYQSQYRAAHLLELQAYQASYRADPAYTTMHRLYMRDYRKRH